MQLLISLILTLHSLFANFQSEKLDLFHSYFNTKNYEDKSIVKKQIPLKLLAEVTNIEIEDAISAQSINILEKNNYNYYLYSVECSAGGYCATHYVYIYSQINQFNKNVKIAFDYSDGSSRETITDIVDDVLVMKIIEEDEEFNESVSFEYYHLDNGKINPIQISQEQYREYYFTSCKLLDYEYLKTFTKNELSIMRNEIFAAKGYIFRSSKWHDFFTQKDWYKPIHNDVVSKLSALEVINIKRIREIELSK